MYHLHIADIQLWVHLGTSVHEQAYPQPIQIDITLHFPDKPKAVETDNIEDTVCYATLVTQLQAHVAHRSFHLIEHLYGHLDQWLSQQGYIFSLSITKVRIPLPHVGRVSFYHDLS